MKLYIKNKQGTVEVSGDFIKENTSLASTHFNYLLDHYEEVVMCLKKVKKIDKDPSHALLKIYNKAHKRSKILFVLGKNNKNIIPLFSRTQTSYIFKNDY